MINACMEYVAEEFLLGDEVWACAFECTKNKEARYLHQKPTKGKK